MARFWDDRAREFAHDDPQGWAAVCHRGAPLYFNRFVDSCQRRAVRRLIDRAAVPPGGCAVDIGCGTGRWTRELARRGLRARGFDISEAMLERARDVSPEIEFSAATASDLPLPTASIDLATCISVLHRLPPAEQPSAVAELSRILRAGGWCVVLVLTDLLPAGRWCYPRGRTGWTELFEESGLRLVTGVGESFLTPALVVQWLGEGFVAMTRGSSRAVDPWAGHALGPFAWAYRLIHRCAVAASYPLEAIAAKHWSSAPALGFGGLFEKEA